jgi:hypothetical protein
MGCPKYRSLAGSPTTATLLRFALGRHQSGAGRGRDSRDELRGVNDGRRRQRLAPANRRHRQVNTVFEAYTVQPLTVGVTVTAHFD